jgi:2-polyprenyl-6-methoxyphenol hydroxylase-like FAD-dependent oxidoreductase
MDTDVLIVGAGPAGLMLAGELCPAGVRPLVLERQPRLRETPKAESRCRSATSLTRRDLPTTGSPDKIANVRGQAAR